MMSRQGLSEVRSVDALLLPAFTTLALEDPTIKGAYNPKVKCDFFFSPFYFFFVVGCLFT